MLLKSADDKSKRLALLGDLQQSQLLDAYQKKWLREELVRFTKGLQGERDSAHYVDNYFRDGENHVVLHDLRFVVDGETAQIDHLILNRASHIYLLETKNYACNLVINDHGEFTADYGNARFGIPSPMEQSRRHERVLVRLLERLEMVGRTQKLPEFHHVVMLHPKAIITRPPANVLDTSDVIKADQFPTWHQSFVGKIGVGGFFKAALNMRSLDTVKEWGEKLMRQHRPADLLELPDFMRPLKPVSKPPREVPSVAMVCSEPTPKPLPVANPAEDQPARKLLCAQCGVKISYAEGKFCWNNEKRFGGLQYCREHQATESR
ncbi:nuclease-related domain-containing protein [Rhodoferax sp.]|uniref:nuclease-related domain-containing protein n=1 Tax=Rhodoferax sp. TaxID=50421 RepID=UPI00374D21C1